ncbi:hypothetical protein [Chryseobacterium salivictor]|uniref:DUF4375 domain-containing protein n=1 Tax=Chryseobacterium salivictor TaxID=2547600 RepID=A0A4P6ZGP5_9FLAO|nr:hypothetical protein [Chryseobacterium salivictor]QBO58890.1 hypothetical protein NBC122_02082 [Chryseobacterium salivictor]
MKKLSLLLILLISNMMFSQNIKELRTLLKTGESSEKSAKTLIEKSSTAYRNSKEPVYGGFLAVGKFFMAKHAFNPLKKMSYFNEGKKTMEQALKADPKNLEIRLMRLITQEKAPSILGYNQQIKEDRNFLAKEYKNTNDEDLKLYIKDYLKL